NAVSQREPPGQRGVDLDGGRIWPALAIGFVALSLACGGDSGPRVLDRPGLGYRVPVPERWVVLGEVLKSRDNSQLSFRVHSLEGAERRFMEGFPDSLIPQLEAWAQASFGLVDAPERAIARIDGVDALELVYPVRARAGVPPSKLIYWVARSEGRAYILRATIPAGAPPSDE